MKFKENIKIASSWLAQAVTFNGQIYLAARECCQLFRKEMQN